MTQQQGGPAAPHCLDKQLARWEERFSIGEYLFREGPNVYLASKATLLTKDSNWNMEHPAARMIPATGRPPAQRRGCREDS